MSNKIPPPYKPATDTATDAAPQSSAPAPPLSGEPLLQRLRYFENLVEQKDKHIDQLKAVITRLGGAAPTTYFAPLTGPGGSYTPKTG